jgi:single-strand DNA-binding protein
MAGDTVITVIGNLTADPELRFTPAGAAVANFTVASTPRVFDRNSNEWKDGEALFLAAISGARPRRMSPKA